MQPARYVQLTPAQDAALKHLYRRTDNADVRSRCQMILLPAQGHSAAEIADLTSASSTNGRNSLIRNALSIGYLRRP